MSVRSDAGFYQAAKDAMQMQIADAKDVLVKAGATNERNAGRIEGMQKAIDILDDMFEKITGRELERGTNRGDG